jgi:hypothetical protein
MSSAALKSRHRDGRILRPIRGVVAKDEIAADFEEPDRLPCRLYVGAAPGALRTCDHFLRDVGRRCSH